MPSRRQIWEGHKQVWLFLTSHATTLAFLGGDVGGGPAYGGGGVVSEGDTNIWREYEIEENIKRMDENIMENIKEIEENMLVVCCSPIVFSMYSFW